MRARGDEESVASIQRGDTKALEELTDYLVDVAYDYLMRGPI